MTARDTIGFIGLGVMGAPICRNLAAKYSGRILAFDRDRVAVENMADTPVVPAESVADLAAEADIIFLSLPGGAQVKAVCGDDGIPAFARPGTTVVDLSTTSVAVAREVAGALERAGLFYADAPVARTREAAQRGELSIMVGSTEEVFSKVKPLLDYIGSDITHCGPVGCGQVVKLINNTLVFEHVIALAEVMVVGERAGVAPNILLEAISKGSGDSFVLRNHGMKAMLPRLFPDRAFPPAYVLKDIDYLLELAHEQGVNARVAELARRYYEIAQAHPQAGRYFPSVIEVVESNAFFDESSADG